MGSPDPRRRHQRRLILALVFAALPLTPEAQTAGKVRRVALVNSTSPVAEMTGASPRHPGTRAFLDEMRVLGYVEGRNLVFERRSAEGQIDRYASILDDLARRGVEVTVIAGNNRYAFAARKASRGAPLVMVGMNDPDKSGLVASLAHPGGNVTGLAFTGTEIEAKRVEILRQALPRVRRVAYLATRLVWEDASREATRNAAKSAGIELLPVFHEPTDYSAAFSQIERMRPDAVMASFTSETYANREAITQFVRRSQLPGIFPYVEMVEAGGLLSYGVNVPDLFRRAAHYVDQILKGAKPANLPIEQPTKFDLVINVKVAKALGIEIPRSVLMRADRLIE